MKKAAPPLTFDPIVATPASAHPILDIETQSFLDREAELGGPLHLLGQEAAQARLEALQAPVEILPVEVDDFTVQFDPAGLVTCRIFRRRGLPSPAPVVFYLHGGGWVTGNTNSHGRFAQELALACDYAVVFVEYSTSVGAHFPVQNEQAYAALCYVVKNAAGLGLKGDCLAIVGDGAGGNMAAAVTIMSHRRKGPCIKFQALLYPIMAIPDLTQSYEEFAFGPWLTAEAMRYYVQRQFSHAALSDIEALPGNAAIVDLVGLPPALIVTVENDVLRDEGESYARKLVQAGVAVISVRYLGCIHDFLTLNSLSHTATAQAAMVQLCAALSSHLGRSERSS